MFILNTFGKMMADHPDLFTSPSEIATSTSSTSQTIPFGKYRHQPFEVLLTDTSYAVWLLNSMYAKLERETPVLLAFLLGRFGMPDCTPEHNRLQNRFLDPTFALRFAFATSQRTKEIGNVIGEINLPRAWGNYVQSTLITVKDQAKRLPATERSRRLAETQDRLKKEATEVTFYTLTGSLQGDVWHAPVAVEELEFEKNGADASFFITTGCAFVSQPDTNESIPSYASEASIVRYYTRDAFRVEVKPLVGDDYPVVLRAMKVAKSTHLLVGDYCGEGATWEQVVRIFGLSGILATLLEDVERTKLPDFFMKTHVQLISADEAVTHLQQLSIDSVV